MRGATKRRTVAHQVASRLLTYPDEALIDQLPLFDRAASELPARVGRPLERCCAYLRSTPLPDLEVAYVDTFDMRRRCCLYLTYYSSGDTRNRGMALVGFVRAYIEAGVALCDDELPDHLAVVLEFSARGGGSAAARLLSENRAGIDLLWRALSDRGSPYADVLEAVSATLPRRKASAKAGERR